jgi:hypothetical protein
VKASVTANKKPSETDCQDGAQIPTDAAQMQCKDCQHPPFPGNTHELITIKS